MNIQIEVYGKISYVSQTAWIQTGTIQENILFGLAMDSERYRETLERCSLVKDLELLPFGDLTEIGERGVNLSGGQKQRLQLARALYQNADIFLLDDPFSALDAQTAMSVFNVIVFPQHLSMPFICLPYLYKSFNYLFGEYTYINGDRNTIWERFLGRRSYL